MTLSNVVIAGGTGFIGSNLARSLHRSGTSVTILTRTPSATPPHPGISVQSWDPTSPVSSPDLSPWERTLISADLVVNVCGDPVVSRWTADNRQRLISSRTGPTSALVSAIKRIPAETRPKCLVNASAVGYYGTSTDAVFDETSAAPAADDFLSDLCVAWEKAATEAIPEIPGVRVVIVRIGVVLGVGGGAMARMLPAYQFFAGGPIGSGEQWVSWVHIDDLVRVITAAGEREGMSGVYNGTAPRAVRMREMAQALADALGRPNLFPVPGFVLKAAFGEGASVVLEGQHVKPKRLLEEGFEFKYADIASAMRAVAEAA